MTPVQKQLIQLATDTRVTLWLRGGGIVQHVYVNETHDQKNILCLYTRSDRPEYVMVDVSEVVAFSRI